MNPIQQLIGSHYQEYDVSISVITQNGWIVSDCADVAFLNTAPVVGGATMTIKGLALSPGQYLSITANDGELDKTQYEVLFGSGVPNCTVIRKLYKRSQ